MVEKAVVPKVLYIDVGYLTSDDDDPASEGDSERQRQHLVDAILLRRKDGGLP